MTPRRFALLTRKRLRGSLTPEEFAEWRLEQKERLDQFQAEQDLLEPLLADLEKRERKILHDLKCPTQPAAIWILLNGSGVAGELVFQHAHARAIEEALEEKRTPTPPERLRWPRKISAAGKAAAANAMLTLSLISQVRRYTRKIDAGSPRLAAHSALLAGLQASNSAFKGVTRRRSHDAGNARGAQATEEAAKYDDDIRAAFQKWSSSDDLRHEHPGPVKYIGGELKRLKKIRLQPWKIRRRLRAMQLRRQRTK